jgi:hypothetical protein
MSCSALLAAAACAPVDAAAQIRNRPRVDTSFAMSAIAAGRYDDAENSLFDEVRRVPREPSTRGALGAFLASRGRLLVGLTLLDETLEFGGDSATVEGWRAKAWRWAGEYGHAAEQRLAPMPEPWREAMRRAGTAATAGPKSATIPLEPNEAFGLGRITLGVGTLKFAADIQPVGEGIVLPATVETFAAVEVIGARGDTTIAVARQISFGGATFGPVPVTLVASTQVARVGLDILGQFTPAFDAAQRTLTVHRGDFVPTGDALPFYLTFPGVIFVPRPDAMPVALQAPAGRAALRGHRWTFDLSRGAIVVEP